MVKVIPADFFTSKEVEIVKMVFLKTYAMAYAREPMGEVLKDLAYQMHGLHWGETHKEIDEFVCAWLDGLR